MSKKTFPLILVLFALLLPGVANAVGNLRQADGNIWTLYVFGNGDAILNILNSVKLLMVPNIGDSGLNGLMTFLAVLGFLVLAVQAGFDPAKNLVKMFSFIVVVAAVHILTTQVKADIYVYDRVQTKMSEHPEQMVAQDVPALVGVPAAIVSDVGEWLTRSIETHFVLAEELTLSGGKRAESGGTFNLFGKIMQETDQVSISDADLKKSLSAYVADCVIPVMAQGTIKVTELMQSPRLTDVLSKAAHNSVLTKYWPMGNYSTSPPTFAETIVYDGDTYTVQGELGTVIPCAGAWGLLETDLDNHSTDLLKGTAAVWARTGVLVPFEDGMLAAMALASNGGANPFANYSRPNGFILQQAFINGMSGTFRSAAASIGNNDLMMSAAIAQAEQSQRTSWFTAARVFGNMMGYVYTVLQAFIFAIVPIVIIALMVPGLGKAIFVNYAQILVWLMLWQPMLSIVNYLITLFGKESLGTVLQMGGGISMHNKAAYSQATNDLLLAAQFLGTSVPLLTWGLVKGAMAFTEFISHGIGSSMAQQAGASAATGNMSMNNMSMDNTSMNKYNTAMSSTVGAQTTMGYTGAMQQVNDVGGNTLVSDGQAQTKSMSTGMGESQKTSTTAALNASNSATKSLSALESLSTGKGVDYSDSKQAAAATSAVQSLALSAQNASDAGNAEAAKDSQSAAQKLALNMVQSAQSNIKGGLKPPGGLGLALKAVGVDVGVDMSLGTAKQKTDTLEALKNAERSLTASLGDKHSTSTATGTVTQGGTSAQNMTGTGSKETYGHDWKSDSGHVLQEALQASRSMSRSMDTQLSTDAKLNASRALSVSEFDAVREATTGMENRVPQTMASATQAVDVGVAQVAAPTSTATRDSATAAIDASPSHEALGQIEARPVNKSIPTAPPTQGGVNLTEADANNRKAVEDAVAASRIAIDNRKDIAVHTNEKIATTGRPIVPMDVDGGAGGYGHQKLGSNGNSRFVENIPK